MTDMIAVPGCDREAISCSLSLFVRNLELGRMLHEYHLSKTSLAVMEDKLNHVRKNVNPALWAETFADDEDFYEAGYQPGDEVELFASDEAGQLAKKRLALLELAAGKAAPPEAYASACECAPPEIWEVSREREADVLRLPHLPQMDIGCLFHQNPHQKQNLQRVSWIMISRMWLLGVQLADSSLLLPLRLLQPRRRTVQPPPSVLRGLCSFRTFCRSLPPTLLLTSVGRFVADWSSVKSLR